MKKLLLLLLFTSGLAFSQANRSMDTLKVTAVKFKGDNSVQTSASSGSGGAGTGNQIEDSLNNDVRTMTKDWTFSDKATFSDSVLLSGQTNKMVYVDAYGYLQYIDFPATFQVYGYQADDGVPIFYHLVGSGGASVSQSSDTIYINTSAGGDSGSITAIQNTDGSLTITDPNGATTTINITAGGIDSAMLATGSVTSTKILNGSINTVDVVSTFKAPYADTADYATTPGTHNHAASELTSGQVEVARGGTGRATFPLFSTPYGMTTSAFYYVPAATSDQMVYKMPTRGQPPSWGFIDSTSILDGSVSTADLRYNAVASGNILDGTIQNSDISVSAAIAYLKLATLNTGQIVAGSGGAATAVTMGGDATIGATGTLTIGTGAITSTKILDGTIATADFNAAAKAPLATLADSAKAAPPGGAAGGDLTGTFPSPSIGSAKVTRAKIDPTVLIGTRGTAGRIATWVASDSLDYIDVLATWLDTSQTVHFTLNSEANNANNLTSGTIPSARLPIANNNTGTFTNATVTLDTYGRVVAASSGTAGSGGGGSTYTGQDAFTTTATSDTVTVLGARSYYTPTVTTIPAARNTLPIAADLINCYVDRDVLYVNRAAGTTSGLAFSWTVDTDSLSPPTAFNVAASNTDSILCTWTLPNNTVASTNRTVDSIVVTYSDAAYLDSPDDVTGANTNSLGKYLLKYEAGADTLYLPDLDNATLYYCQAWSKTTDDFYSTTGSFSQDTVTTGSSASFSPSDVTGLYAWYDIQDYTVTNNNGTDSVSYLTDKSGNSRYLTSRDTLRPIVYDSTYHYLQFRKYTDATHATRDESMLADTARVSSLFNGGELGIPKTAVIFMVMRADTFQSGTTPQTFFQFSNTGTYNDIYSGGIRRDGTTPFALGLRLSRTYDASLVKTLAPFTMGADTVDLTDSINIVEWHMEGDSIKIFFNSDNMLGGTWATATSALGGLDTFYVQHANRFTLGCRWSAGTAVPFGASDFRLYEMIIYTGVPGDSDLIKIREYLDTRYSTPYVP